MKPTIIAAVSMAFLGAIPTIVLSAQTAYCSQNQTSIQIGMTEDEVLSACGKPTQRTAGSGIQAVQRVPVKQLIYNAINKGTIYPGLTSAFYDQWTIPSGDTGLGLMVNLINNKVSSVSINGASTNAMNLCGGASIQVGDDVNQVYASCGQPSLVNTTYIDRPMPASSKPEVWVYQIDQYQPRMNLTFVNGRLESID